MELTLDQALQKGVEAHKAGKVQDADRYYTAILKANPKHADANHNMGVLAVGVGKVEAALPFFKKALEANSSIGQFWLSYIDALIKLERIADAKAVLEQAKSKGANGDGFDQLEKRLIALSIETKESVKDQDGTNILDTLQLGQAVKLALTRFKEGSSAEAKRIYQDILVRFPKNKKAIAGLKKLSRQGTSSLKKSQDPPQAQLQELIELYTQGNLQKSLEQCKDLSYQYPKSVTLLNILGAVLKGLGQIDLSIETFNKAISVKPNFVEAYNNMGLTLRDQGKQEEAKEAFNKAISIKPDFAEAYNNMGLTLQDQGKQEEAKEAFNKAITIKPDFAEAHRHLSSVTKYNSDTAQISKVEALLQRTGLNESDRCNLLYTHAKMQEDLGDLSAAFDSYVKGGDLRQRLLKYEFTQDENLFDQIKRTAPQFKDVALNVTGEPIRHSPIFILGMPRSGTTLVEQIVSSHSEVTGAGELEYVTRFGAKLVAGLTNPTLEAVSTFRERYLVRLAKRADGQACITDKTPLNFKYIALICAAFPEAKIVHVQRSAEATCWSNFKHYFVSKGFGYCYSLRDTIAYYGLYKELMHFWSQSYSDRIYNLDYDKLTEDQEPETWRLIKYLELNWEDACLSPQKNKRSVRTASKQQVRQKVYTGSSQVWKKYEPYLNGAFDRLPSS